MKRTDRIDFGWDIVTPSGVHYGNSTRFNINGTQRHLRTVGELRKLLKNLWCRATDSKNFQDYADHLNADTNYSYNGACTKDDAIANMADTFILNINTKHIDIWDWWKSIED